MVPSWEVWILFTIEPLSFKLIELFSIFISTLDSEKTLNIFDKQVLPPKTNKLNLWVNLIYISLFISFDILFNKSNIWFVIIDTAIIIKILFE